MSLILVDQGEEQLLDLALAVGYTLKLYTNDLTAGLTAAQVDALTQAAFTEATFAGYTSKTLTGGAWTTTPGAPGVGSYAEQTWTRSTTGTVQLVYGYYVVRTSDGALSWFEPFSGPIPVQYAGDTVRVTPRLTMQDDQDDPGAIGGTIAGMSVLSVARTADAGTALNEAIAALPDVGGTIVIPAGTWTVDTPVLISKDGVIIQGVSQRGTLLRFAGATITPAIKNSSTTQRYCVVRDLRIESSNSGSGVAIDASYFVNSMFHNLRIGGGGVNPNRGIVFDAVGSYYNVVQDCRISVAGAGSRCLSFANVSNSNVVRNCRLVGDNTNTVGVYVDAHAIQLDHVDMESDGLVGVDVAAGGHDCQLNAPYLEALETGVRLAADVESFTCVGGVIIDNVTNITDLGAKDPAFINTRVQYEPYTSFTARSAAFPQSYPVQTASDQPQDHALAAWTVDPATAEATTLLVNGTQYLAKVHVRNRVAVTKVWWIGTSGAVTPTAGQNWVGLYNSAGTLLASAGIDTQIAATGPQSATITSTVLEAGSYWVVLLCNAVTAATLARAGGQNSAANSVNQTSAALRFAVNGTGKTALDAAITPASNTSTGSSALFAAVS